MSERKVKVNGVMTAVTLDKTKKYKYNKSGDLVEATTVSDSDIIIAGSKSSLRRIADLERNVSILATQLTTTDGQATDTDDASFATTVTNTTRFKATVRQDAVADHRANIDMNGNKIVEVGTPSAATDAANKSYVDTAVTNGLNSKDPVITLAGDASGSVTLTNLGSGTLTVTIADDSHNHTIANVDGLQAALDAKLASASYTAADVLTKIKTVDGAGSGLDADLLDGQSSAYYATAASVTSEASTRAAGDTSTLTSAQSYTDTAISNLVNGASAAFDTLSEIQNAMATDAELSAAIAAITVGNGTMTVAAGTGMTGGGAFSANQTGASTVTLSHADTSTVANVTASGRKYVTGLTFDGFGHVTGVTTGTETVVNTDTNTTYTAGAGLTLTGTVFSLTDLSTATSLTALTGANVVSDIDVDAYGRVTALATRTMTLENLGYVGALNANYITNTNQLTNGSGYVTSSGVTSVGVAAGNGLTGGGTVTTTGTLTLNVVGGNGISVAADSVTMSGAYSGNFTVTGAITATGDVTAYSDDRLKTDVVTIDGAMDRVSAIRGVNFTRISDGSRSTGVVAQELKAVLPEAVHTDENGVHHVAYGNVVGLLIEAVKELKAEIEALKF
jgi:hypothetical protein